MLKIGLSDCTKKAASQTKKARSVRAFEESRNGMAEPFGPVPRPVRATQPLSTEVPA